MDRRAFVKLAVGSAAGFAASPLMPKLTDDLGIWTTNWSWVPKPEAGDLAFANSVNPATGTGVRVRMVTSRLSGQRLIRVEGDPDHPLSRGGVAPADAAALQVLYHEPMRLKAPRLREARTNAPHEVGWDEALQRVVRHLAHLHKAGRPEGLVILADEPGSTLSHLLARFAGAFGSPNLVFWPRPAATLALAGELMFGLPEIGFDLENADYVVSFGTPLFEGFGAPVATRKALAAWRDDPAKRVPFVQVEPYASVTAGLADTWLACKPGTEGLVALGIGHLLVKSGAYDQKLAESAFGFEETPEGLSFKKVLIANYAPDQVARLSGVPAAKLQAVAQAFATARRPLAVCGPDNAGGPGRLYDFLSVLALNALRGNLGQPGGVVARAALPLRDLGGPLPAPKAPRLDLSPETPLPVSNISSLAVNGLNGRPYPPEVVIVAGMNPVFSGPQAKLMGQLLDAAGLAVVITPYLDETALQADVALPAGMFLESFGDCITPYASPRAAYGIHRPLIQVEKNARSAGDIVLELARLLGGEVAQALPFKDGEAALQARTADLGDFAKLCARGHWVQEKPAYGPLGFKTPSGQLEFVPQRLAQALAAGKADLKEMVGRLRKLGLNAPPQVALMPHYELPMALELVSSRHPLLMAAIPSLRTGDGPQPNAPYQIKLLGNGTLARRDRLVVELNPLTARELHLAEGDQVEIISPAGKLGALLHLFAGAAPGVVYVPRGLGHRSLGGYLEGIGGNFQELVVLTQDPLSGLPQWDYTPVTVRAASEVSHG